MLKIEKTLKFISPSGGTSVQVPDGELSSALRKFNRLVAMSGKFSEIYRRRHYQKPSLIRRREKNNAAYRNKKERDY